MTNWIAWGILAANVAWPPDLRNVAQAATAMLDGDICARIQTLRSKKFLVITDPRDPWRAGDNYDVDAAAFTATKKTLIRLSHLCPTVCDVNLWMPMPERAGRVQVVIRNVHEISAFWKWGDMDQLMPPEMQRVLTQNETVTLNREDGISAMLAPVYDSLGTVVAIAEVVSKQNPDSQENVK